MATAEDISAAAAFLCSPAARNISSQVLPVNAGEPASLSSNDTGAQGRHVREQALSSLRAC
jgi:NAD(P)-dependent dehydrogenase (short-subunit alcohol dehydrogenase family)